MKAFFKSDKRFRRLPLHTIRQRTVTPLVMQAFIGYGVYLPSGSKLVCHHINIKNHSCSETKHWQWLCPGIHDYWHVMCTVLKNLFSGWTRAENNKKRQRCAEIYRFDLDHVFWTFRIENHTFILHFCKKQNFTGVRPETTENYIFFVPLHYQLSLSTTFFEITWKIKIYLR